jgi:hypothetical protein
MIEFAIVLGSAITGILTYTAFYTGYRIGKGDQQGVVPPLPFTLPPLPRFDRAEKVERLDAEDEKKHNFFD